MSSTFYEIPAETPMESAPDTAAVAPSTAGHSLPSTAGNLGTPDDSSPFPFPTDMKRAATQSPIPSRPTGGRQRSSGFEPYDAFFGRACRRNLRPLF